MFPLTEQINTSFPYRCYIPTETKNQQKKKLKAKTA